MQRTPWDPEGVEPMLDANGGLADADAAAGLDLRALYKRLVALRCLDLKLARLGLPMWANAAGEEAVLDAVGTLPEPDDWIFVGARDAGVALGRGVEIEEIVAQSLGHRRAETAGRSLPGHVSCAERNLVSGIEALGVGVALASGCARAQKLAKTGGAALALFGEGLTTTGPVHEALAIAVKESLPLVAVCKSRPWPDGAPAEAGLFGDSAAERINAYGIRTRRTDGADALGVRMAIADALERARESEGPSFVEVVVTPTSADPPPERDPIERLRRHLDAQGEWSKTFQDVIEGKVRGHIDKALQELQEADA